MEDILGDEVVELAAVVDILGGDVGVTVAVGVSDDVVTVALGSVPNATERKISVCGPSTHP